MRTADHGHQQAWNRNISPDHSTFPAAFSGGPREFAPQAYQQRGLILLEYGSINSLRSRFVTVRDRTHTAACNCARFRRTHLAFILSSHVVPTPLHAGAATAALAMPQGPAPGYPTEFISHSRTMWGNRAIDVSVCRGGIHHLVSVQARRDRIQELTHNAINIGAHVSCVGICQHRCGSRSQPTPMDWSAPRARTGLWNTRSRACTDCWLSGGSATIVFR